MNKAPLVKVVLLLAPAFLTTALAQDDDAGDMVVTPVETYACSYNEGKGPTDVKAAVDAWSAWMDEQGITNYFGLLVTPQYFGESKMDFGWLGAAPSGEAMGANTDKWTAGGSEVAMKFAEASTCHTHTNFASTMIKSPGEGPPPDQLVLSFENCSVTEDANWEAAMGALDAWAAYQTENGYSNGAWLMFPAYGEADGDYGFKLVQAYDSHTELGKAWDLYGNGGGYQKYGELMGGVVDCDTARVYDATVIRRQAEE